MTLPAQFTKTISVLGLGLACWASPFLTTAADANSPLPAVIQAGFDSWVKGGGVDGAVYVWQKGGVLEGRAAEMSNRLRRASQTLGNYLDSEQLKRDPIGRSSEVIYLSINFQRGAVYARFLMYHTDKGWVVQDMDFSTRPEAIMPWLAFAGERTME